MSQKYSAGSGGLTRVDLTTGVATHLDAEPPFGAITAVDAHGPSVFVLQQSSDGPQLLRCKLDRAGRAIASTSIVGPASAIGRGAGKLYYVAGPGVIKSVREQP